MTSEALGLWNVGEDRFHNRLSSTEAKRIIRTAWEKGIRTFDSAYSYTDADSILYSALKDIRAEREEWRIIEKIMPVPTFAKKAEASLKRLHTSYFDTLLMHWPAERENLYGTLKALERMKNSGMAAEIGVSNFPLPLLKTVIRDFPLSAHERPLSLVWTKDYEEEKRLGIRELVYAPLGMGILSAKKEKLTPLFFSSSSNLESLYLLLDETAGKKDATRTDIALSWVYNQEPDVVIRGVSDKAQLQWKRAELTEEENSRLKEAADLITAEAEEDNIFSHRWQGVKREET